MKKFVSLGVIAIVMSNITLSNADDMRPLRYVLKQEQSPQILVYAYERCSGLFGAAYAAFSDSKREQAKKIASTFLLKSADATLAAVELGQQHNINISMEKSQANSIRIMDRYKDAMKESRDMTGNQFSPEILDDQDQCLAMLDNKSKYFSLAGRSSSPKIFALEPEGFQKSELESKAPDGCKITALMNTSSGHLVGQQFSLMITPENHLGIALDGVLKMPSGQTIKLKRLSGQTSAKLEQWHQDPNAGSIIIGKNALNFAVDYLEVTEKFAGWVLERNTFDLKKDFIFMEFEAGDTTYTAPLLFGKSETKFTPCTQKTAEELAKRRGG